MAQWRVLVPIGIALALWGLGIVQLNRPADLLTSGAASQSCRTTAAERAAHELATTAEVTPTPVPHPIIATELVALEGNIPTLRPSLVVRAPANADSEIDMLLGTSLAEIGPDSMGTLPERSSYRMLLNLLLENDPKDVDDLGIFVIEEPADAVAQSSLPDPVQDVRNLIQDTLEMHQPPVVGVGENGTVTLAVPGDPEVLTDNTSTFAGGWVVTSSGRNVELHMKGRPPARTEWDISVCTEGLPIIAADLTSPPAQASRITVAAPLLLSRTSHSVRWSIPPSTEPADVEVEVVVQVSPLAALRMWLFSDPRNISLATALAYAVPAALILASLRLVPQASSALSTLGATRERLEATTWAVVRLTLAAVATLFLVGSLETGYALISPSWQSDSLVVLAVVAVVVVGLGFLDVHPRPEGEMSERHRGSEIALALVAIGAIAASFIYLANAGLPRFRVWPLVNPAILIAGYTMLLVTAFRVWRRRADSTLGRWTLMALPATGAVCLLLSVLRLEVSGRNRGENWFLFEGQLIPLWVTLCFVVGFVLLAIALMRTTILGMVPLQTRPWVRRIGWSVAVVLILIAILAQWGWAQYNQQTIWWRAPVEADPAAYLPEVYRDRLHWLLPTYLFSFFLPVIELLLILGLAGLLGVLRAEGLAATSPFLTRQQRWVKWALAGLFATFVVGYGGEVLGFRAPAAFFLALALLPLAWTDRLGEVSRQIDQRNADPPPETPLVVTERETLLHRALALADLDHQREAMHSGYAKRDPVKHAADYLTTLHDLDRQTDALYSGRPADDTPGRGAAKDTDDTAALVLEPGEAPGELAVALGPQETWWHNGVQAARTGAGLAILPVAYFAYVFLTSQGGGGWSLSTPFAMAGFFSSLAYEVAFWLMAAFVFGCLFPYWRGKNGLVKGAVLASVYVAANAAAALLGIPGSSLWQVRSFQLLLFLMLLGALLDRQTIESFGLPWRYLLAHYELARANALVSQVLPLAAAFAGVVLQLFSGQTQEATANLVSGDASRAIMSFVNNLLRPVN